MHVSLSVCDVIPACSPAGRIPGASAGKQAPSSPMHKGTSASRRTQKVTLLDYGMVSGRAATDRRSRDTLSHVARGYGRGTLLSR